MKKLFILLTAFVFLTPILIYGEEEGYYGGRFARLSYVKGDVYIQKAADSGYQEGVVNLPVIEGDKLGTRDGRAEIHLGRRNYLRIDRNTQIDFAKLPKREGDAVKLHMLSGSIYLRINFIDREKNYEVHTPDASFYILEQGLYRFEVRENKETELQVYEGSVEAAGEEGSVLVKSEEQMVASDGRLQSQSKEFYGVRDEFADWNETRDALLKPHAASRYLPSEINEYEDELDDNGRWAYEEPYGYVWIPHVYYNSWRPYYYGRWVWYPIIGWTWVSDEPWGWCVYHYGRWHWGARLGWYWIPTHHWGPAWVHWWWDYDYIGWCPLSYYGYPVVVINNYFYDHYRDPYYPAHSRALTMIHRNQLQAPHVSHVALDQAKVSSLGKISLRAKQPDIKPVLDRSPILRTEALKALSGENVRQVGKSFISGKALIPRSELKAVNLRSYNEDTGRTFPRDKSGVLDRRDTRGSIRELAPGNLSRGREISPSSKTGTSLSPRNIRPNPGRYSSPDSPSRSGIKTYERRLTSPSSSVSSRTYSRDSIEPFLSRFSSSRDSEPRSSIREYTPQYRYSSPSEDRSLGGYIRDNTRYFGSRNSGYRYPSSSYLSPSYRYQDRDYSRGSSSSSSGYISPRSGYSSSGHYSYSSPRSSGSYSRSAPSFSGSRSSSSSSASRGRIRRK
jgi:hypothetical protein